MKHFRKIWDKEKHDWLLAHKDMNRQNAYELFCKVFPKADVTQIAFYNERSRIGACKKNISHGSTKARPLYSEQYKKGYVRIKIAQPSVWISKAKWVYMETHPWEDFSEQSNYVFLDGNTKNFSPENIERVPLRVMRLYCQLGGCEPGNPEITKVRIALAKVRLAMFDAGENAGLVSKYKNGRSFRAEKADYAKKYNAMPERKKIVSENKKRYMQKLKAENPEKYQEILRKNRERRRRISDAGSL